jgi:hypothetical protein
MTTEFTDSLPVVPADPEPPAAVEKPEPTITPPAAPKSSRWKELLVTALVASLVAATAAIAVLGGGVVALGLALGWFTPAHTTGGDEHTIGSVSIKYNDTLLTEKGRLTIPTGETVEVFYPEPFTNPPMLTWKTDGQDYFKVTDQKPTGFKVKSNLSQPWDLQWEASGVGDKKNRHAETATAK